jgi:hypothetical protein
VDTAGSGPAKVRADLPGADESTPGFREDWKPWPQYHVPVPKAGGTRSTAGKSHRCLHLFSGKAEREDGLAAYLRSLGWVCVDVDKLNEAGEFQDILDDTSWEHWRAKLKNNFFDFVFCGVPCETFSVARHKRPGPKPLRSWEHIYGLPHLEQELKEQVRIANLLVLRAVEACRIVAGQGGGFAIENPPEHNLGPSLFDMPEIQKLAEEFQAKSVRFDQCMYGAISKKPTKVLFHGGPFQTLQQKCNHPKTEQVDDKGNKFWAPHAPVAGRHTKDGNWATKQLASYPQKLNRRLACCINMGASRKASPDDEFQ